ncbi:FMN-binding negative transcriptional regulator [Marihabitans asiaticum]|uniref:PaiB family negative transcriptional regulator n=1 Tax=Marihabitans asiaticum TaxID=415218 RepID=A0A560WH39_9MICO|nr:FMN-binding negative transcriptional regulator [Marihabitans asiaticum]TWD16814.1 PaiB family negative transcriptional regulator [Marihabitans asiaticum]
MWINPVFAETEPDALDRLVRDYSLATLIVEDPLRVAHVPLLLKRSLPSKSADADRLELVGHIPLADPAAEAIQAGSRVLSIFQGATSYISPAWYEQPGLPTYNFTVAHLAGPAVVMKDDDALRAHLVDLIAHHEQIRRAQGPVWTMDDTAHRRMDQLLPQIIGFRVLVEEVEIKAKLGQNRSLEDQHSVASCLWASGASADHYLADQMHAAAKRRETPDAT